MANLVPAGRQVLQTLPGGLRPSTATSTARMIDVTPPAAAQVRTVAPAAVKGIEAAAAKNPRSLSTLGKAVIGTTAVGGIAAGTQIDDIINGLNEMAPVDRMEVVNSVGEQFPEIAENLRSVNNALAQQQRQNGAAQYQPNHFGEHNIIADKSVPGISDFLDPSINEVHQMLDSTYAKVRSRMSLDQIKALQWLINNCNEENLNVLEDRWQYAR